MILTADKIRELGLVHNRRSAGERCSTYDATVGEIAIEGQTVNSDRYVLPSRGMAWVISHEHFELPADITGLATLRTTWTHNGILALNVGVIDPGWHGRLATALVNFSNANFEIQKGDSFLRVIFCQHEITNMTKNEPNDFEYLRLIRTKSALTPKTFLNLSKLADEMLTQFHGSSIFSNKIAKYAAYIGIAAIILAILGIFIPISYGISTEWVSKKEQIKILQEDIAKIKSDIEKLPKD